MAVMRDIVNDVLDELRFGSGQDVQIHLQTGIVKNVSRVYRSLMLKHVWRDYHFVNTYTTDATGAVPTLVPDTLDKFSNIIAVYLDKHNDPLPVAPVSANPLRFRRPVLLPVGGASIFKILPALERDIVVVSRMYQEADFDMDDEVPFYRDVLMLATASMLATKAGTNERLAQSLQAQFTELMDTYRVNEMQTHYQTSLHRSDYPTDWFVNE